MDYFHNTFKLFFFFDSFEEYDILNIEDGETIVICGEYNDYVHGLQGIRFKNSIIVERIP